MVNIRKALMIVGSLAITVAVTLALTHPTVAALAPLGEYSRVRALGQLKPGAASTLSASGARQSRAGAVKIAIIRYWDRPGPLRPARDRGRHFRGGHHR